MKGLTWGNNSHKLMEGMDMQITMRLPPVRMVPKRITVKGLVEFHVETNTFLFCGSI